MRDEIRLIPFRTGAAQNVLRCAAALSAAWLASRRRRGWGSSASVIVNFPEKISNSSSRSPPSLTETSSAGGSGEFRSSGSDTAYTIAPLAFLVMLNAIFSPANSLDSHTHPFLPRSRGLRLTLGSSLRAPHGALPAPRSVRGTRDRR